MLPAPEHPHREYPHVYAILRFDLYMSTKRVEDITTVVKVLASRDQAEQGAARLRDVNRGKNCIYAIQITRFIGNPPTAEG